MKAGQIFSNDDKMSKQIDVVIYDNVFLNFFKKDSSAYLFPCEAIYGSIEVKTMLDEKSFKDALENVKSVRELKRENANCLDITPLRHLDLSKSNFRYNENRTNEYLNIIFAYDSVGEKTLTEYIQNWKVIMTYCLLLYMFIKKELYLLKLMLKIVYHI